MGAFWRKASGWLVLTGLLLAATPSHAQLACLLPGLLSGITNSIACGPNATFSGENSNAFGGSSSASANALAVGANSVANVNAVALGYMASASASGSVAIGNNSVANVANTVSFGSVGNERKLVNVAAGTISATSTNAVNGAQLFATNASISNTTSSITTLGNNALTLNQRLAAIFGGGSALDASNIVTAPSYSIQGASYSSIGGAFSAVDTRLTSDSTAITNLSTQINSGGIGLVTQDAVSRQIQVGASTDGAVVDFTGTAGVRKLTGLQAGLLSASSTDAVNGSQLFATNNSVGANTASITTLTTNATTLNQRLVSIVGAGASVDVNGVLTLPSYSIQGASYTSIGGAFGAVDSALTSANTSITNLTTEINSGGIGLVTQDAVSRQIQVGASTDGAVVDFTGTAGKRKLTGLSDGTIAALSADAVTGNQLFSTNIAVAANTSAIDVLNTNSSTLNQRLAMVFGGGASVDANGVLTAPSFTVLGSSYNNVSGALNALSDRVQTNSSNISALQSAVGGSGPTFVTQDATTRTLNVGAATDGTSVDFTGTSGSRQLTGVANGSISATSTDAVNGSQLNATNSAIAATTNYATNAANGIASAIGGGASVDASGNVTNPQFIVQDQTYSTVATAVGAIDAQLTSQAAMINSVVSNVNNMTQNQRYVSINGMGNDASATGSNAIAVGVNASSTAANSIAVGTDSLASQNGSIAIGATSQATGVNAIAIGTGAVATGSVAVGVNASASNGGAAFGDNAVATGSSSVALGPGAVALAPNSVAIGAGSVSNVANTVSVGSPGNERRITNVAAGINPTDAVNVSQLNNLNSQYGYQISRLDQRINNTVGGVAMAMALTGSSLPSDMKVATAVNVGTYGGQTALGISQYFRLTSNVVLSGGVALQDKQAGGRAGVMVAW